MLKKKRFGCVETIADGVVTGWAIDTAIQPALLFVFIDGKPVANCACSFDRPDLDSANLPGRTAGFNYRIPPNFLDGNLHQIAIRFSNGEFLDFLTTNGSSSNNQGSFQMDLPFVLQGWVDGLENGVVRGWMVIEDYETGRKLGGGDVVVIHDNREVDRVKADQCRPDVGKALECDPFCGFVFTPPVRYRDGRRYEFRFLSARRNIELSNSPLEFQSPAQAVSTKLSQFYGAIETMSTQLWRMKRDLRSLLNSDIFTLANYDAWARQYQKTLRFRLKRSRRQTEAPCPLVSILCPVYRPRIADFTAAVESVLAQSYANWELIVVDDNSKSKELSNVIAAFCARDPRILAIPRRKNGGISSATNTALDAAKGDYVALFDHDDLLLDVAIEIMVEAAQRTGAKLLYSDEDKIDDYGRFSEPNLKPDWNYRLLLGQNYVCHFLMVAAEALRRAGPLQTRYDGAQDHDLVLRLSEILRENEIFHVPEVVYHWRKTPGSTASAMAAKSYAVDAGAAAVRDHLKRRGYDVTVSSQLGMTTYQVDWQFRAEPKVCIIVPFREYAAMTRKCLDKIIKNTAYRNFEVILVDNWSQSPEAAAFCLQAVKIKNVRVLRVEEPFNYSRLNNLACQETEAEFFLFMNNDVFVDQKSWLRLLIDEALADAKVGAVGAKLLFPHQTVQHGGVILGVGGPADHAYRGRAANDPGFMGRGICAQELSAVTAALMLCRAEAFLAVGGFDEADLAVAYNDVDLCLKLRKIGYSVIWTPAVVAEHHESISRGDDMSELYLARLVFEEQTLLSRWRDAIERDPFYNRHFSRAGGLFNELSSTSVAFEPEVTRLV